MKREIRMVISKQIIKRRMVGLDEEGKNDGRSEALKGYDIR